MHLNLYLKSWFLFLVSVALGIVDGSPEEKELIQSLLKDLDPLERPVERDGENVTVKLGVTLMTIVNVDIEKQHIELTLWTRLEWYANNLQWDEKQHNISEIRLPTDRIWMPDIYKYNQVVDFDPNHKTPVIIQSNGSVTHVPPSHSITSCYMNTRKYPLEEFICELQFGSWTHGGNKVDVQLRNNESGDIASLISNAEWKVLEFPGSRTVNYYSCCPEPYVDVRFSLKIRRRGDAILSYAKSMIITIAGLLLMSLSFDPSSTLKILFGLCAMFLCAGATKTFNPSFGKLEPPEIATYFVHLFFISFSVLCTSVFTYTTFYRLGEAPEFIKKLLVKSPIPRPKFDSTSMFKEIGQERDDGGGGDLRELVSSRSVGVGVGVGVNDWKYLVIVLDKFLFYFWTVFIFIYFIVAFPSFDY